MLSRYLLIYLPHVKNWDRDSTKPSKKTLVFTHDQLVKVTGEKSSSCGELMSR